MARRVHELRAVVLADAEGVESDHLGEDRLLNRVPDHLVAADRQPGLVDRYRQERVESKLERRHRLLAHSSMFGWYLFSNVTSTTRPRSPAGRAARS